MLSPCCVIEVLVQTIADKLSMVEHNVCQMTAAGCKRCEMAARGS